MAPRFALAYDPKGDGKTVFRKIASWGISYDYNAGELWVNAHDALPPYGGTEIFGGNTFSNPYCLGAPAGCQGDVGGNIFPYVANAQAPFAANGVYLATPAHFKTTSVNQCGTPRFSTSLAATGWCRPNTLEAKARIFSTRTS